MPAVQGAVSTDVGYIGVMGSRTTHEKRMERLREAGVSAADLARLMSPIGLDIGARTPEETAISICAEIIATRTGKAAPEPEGLRGPDPRLRCVPRPNRSPLSATGDPDVNGAISPAGCRSGRSGW